MDDVRAVMDAVGCERAALFGYSEGGPMCVLFAATYPERVTALVLYGTYAKRATPARTTRGRQSWAERVSLRGRDRARVGRESDLGRMWPNADDERFAAWWASTGAGVGQPRRRPATSSS